MKILILCTGNSCRSQMAEGFLQNLDKNILVSSAGIKPEKEVNRHAIKVMKEIGIDISKKKPHNITKYEADSWDYLITVCDEANKASQFFPGEVRNRIHKGFIDPFDAKGTEEEILSKYRIVRNEIEEWITRFYELCVKDRF